MLRAIENGGGTVKDPRTPKNRLGVGSFRWPWRRSERGEEKENQREQNIKVFSSFKKKLTQKLER